MAGVESLEDFRQRSRAWLAGNMRRLPPDAEPWNAMRVDEGDAEQAKELQGKLFEAGFAGLCFPEGVRGPGFAA